MNTVATALVTGGAGFVGTNLCLELKKRGYEVRCLDNNHGEQSRLFMANEIEFYYDDVFDQERLNKAAKDVDVIFHLATMCLPYSLEKDPRYTLEVSTKGTYNAFRSAHAYRTRGDHAFFVYVSSSEVYGNGVCPMEEGQDYAPRTIYGAAKAAGELVTKAYGALNKLPYLIIRPFNCYGPYAREDMYATIITKMLRALLPSKYESMNRIIVFNGDGTQGRDFTYVQDTVEGIIEAYEHREKLALFPIVNVCSGKETSLNDLWDLCLDVVPNEAAQVVYGSPRLGDIIHMWGSPWYCKSTVGWKPRFKLEEGLKEYVKWLSEKHESGTV